MNVDNEAVTAAKPKIVTADEWQRARDELMLAEKEATRVQDALAAQRRRLPMVKFDSGYAFDTPDGTKTLLDLFDGRDQLVTYQFMDNGPDDYCPGCTAFTNSIPRLGRIGWRCRDHLGYGIDHAAGPDRGVQGADGLDGAVRVVARHVVLG